MPLRPHAVCARRELQQAPRMSAVHQRGAAGGGHAFPQDSGRVRGAGSARYEDGEGWQADARLRRVSPYAVACRPVRSGLPPPV